MTLCGAWRGRLRTWGRKILTCSTVPRDEGCSHGGSSRGIPLSTKLCYAIGGIPFQMTNISLGFSFQIFLLDVVRMEAFFVSLILFVSRAWDAVTDPLVGYLVSRSSGTAMGKFLPWVMVSTPLGILAYILLWFMPQPVVTSSFSVPWYLGTSCLFETVMSCYNVPYTSLNMFLGGDQGDRDSATAYRMSVEALAMLAGAVIQGQVIRVYNTERDQACHELDQTLGQTHSVQSPHAAILNNTRKAFMTSALAVGAVFFLCSLVLSLGVRERQGPLRSPGQSCIPYRTGLKMLVGHVPYQRLVLGFLFCTLAFQMSFGNFALYCTHVAGLGTRFQYLILALLIATTVFVPVWQAVLVRLGKKTTTFIGLPLLIPSLIVFVTVSNSFAVYMVMCVLAGASLAALFLLPWSMLPDVVDDFAVKNPSCRDLEPLFFSCYAFCSKLGGGVSVGISTMVLHLAGYEAGACSHGDGVVTALRVLLAPVPIVLLLVGLVLFCLYPINEAHRQQLQRDLEQTCITATPPPHTESDLRQSQQLHRSSLRSTSGSKVNDLSLQKLSTSISKHSNSKASSRSNETRDKTILSSPHADKSGVNLDLNSPESSSKHRSDKLTLDQNLHRDRDTHKYRDIPNSGTIVTWV